MSAKHRKILQKVNGYLEWRRYVWRVLRTPSYASVDNVTFVQTYFDNLKCPLIRLTTKASRRRARREASEMLEAKGRAFSRAETPQSTEPL